jgi:valyl-tRNA synthetase
LFKDNFSQVKEISKSKTNTAFYTKFSDGSISYSEIINNRSYDDIIKVIKEYPFYDSMIGLDKSRISKAKAKQFENLILWLIQKKVKLTFFLSPFPPLVFDHYMNEKYRTAISEIETYLHDLAKENKIEVRGTYDPHLIGAGDGDFYDSFHVKRDKLDILWNFISK